MKKIIIAIDGFSSTGKSTIAKKVAQALQYIYVDTGAMYRAVAYMAEKEGLISHYSFENQYIIENLKQSHIEFKHNAELGYSEIFLNGENIENKIRSIGVANIVSQVAKIPQVRTYLVDLQRNMAKEKGVVMDGRDIGTVVFPDAELKIFMTASEEIRAQRRYNELISKGETVTFDSVLENIRQRDYTDTHRQESPLKKASDAIELDNSYISIEELVQRIVDLAEAKIK